MFSAYRGKDSRFALEQNIGPSVAGDQCSGWLFQQTKQLQEKGVILTISGDSPFLLRLILGISTERTSQTRSQLPLYIPSNEESCLPTTCDSQSGFRTKVEIPFRTMLPIESLVYLKDIRQVCPDITHCITRCVESDLKKLATEILTIKHPWEKESIRVFEKNLTMREIKKPKFEFKISESKSGRHKCTVGQISLSGTAALTAIADKVELMEASPEMTDIFDGIWKDDELIDGSNDISHNCVKVLQSLHENLFNKSTRHDKPDRYMSWNDGCQLLRKSLNNCVIMLRNSKEGLDLTEFTKWAETYYQASIMLLGEEGLTPYKLKLLLFPTLIESGFIKSPWDHMCEGVEKSNHHAHRNFQTKSMRGGGLMHNHDPLFLDTFFSFCGAVKIKNDSLKPNEKLINILDEAIQKFPEYEKFQSIDSAPTYLEICGIPYKPARIAVGELRNYDQLLAGMRFVIVGGFSNTEASRFGDQQNPRMAPQEVVKKWIKELGGGLMTHDRADTLLHDFSETPNCYVLVKDGTDLFNATRETVVEKCGPNDQQSDSSMSNSDSDVHKCSKKRRSKKNSRAASDEECSTSCDDSDNGKKSNTVSGVRRLSLSALLCRKFAGGNFKFLTLAYITETRKLRKIIDPNNFELQPGPSVKKINLCTTRPLLRNQLHGESPNNISALTALRRYRNKNHLGNLFDIITT